MCVAAPGEIVELDGRNAVIDYSGNRVHANAGIVDCKVGDRVLVHAGMIIQVLSNEEAEDIKNLFDELEAL